MTKVSMITIGTELLKGRIVNTNASDAGLLLRNNGYTLDRVIAIADTKEAIRDTILSELSASDIVLVSGGLGPTKDDITKHTLAEIFDSRLVEHKPTLDFLENRYASRQRTMTRLTRLQAMVPEVCEVVPNTQGTAPGMMFNQNGKLLFSMPGVPFEMLHMLEFGVIPLMKTYFPTKAFLHRTVRITGVPESVAAERMEAIEPEIPPHIEIAYLPRHDGLWLELFTHAAASDRSQAETELDKSARLVSDLFSHEVYALGEKPLPAEVADLFHAKDLTLAVAESLTGGAIAAQIVSVSGASKFFRGSVTAYATPVKIQVLTIPGDMIERHGVVSEAVAIAMAEGVRKLMGADVGIATTGFAEPDGENKPHAWLGYSDRFGVDAAHIEFIYKRNVNIERAAGDALKLCLKNVRTRFE
ncbi:MAG: CinA family nicotinamide mononucleotide deamidase-related protein [Bacteroidia bacterium]